MKASYLTLAACLALASTLADAAQARHAAPAHRAAPAGLNLACEGSSARIVTGFGGAERTEHAIAFAVRAAAGSPTVALMNVTGTRVIKPGRYVASLQSGNITVTVPWIDGANQQQTLVLTIDRQGNFAGDTAEAMPAAASYLCNMLGDACGLMRADIRIELSGTCWGQ